MGEAAPPPMRPFCMAAAICWGLNWDGLAMKAEGSIMPPPPGTALGSFMLWGKPEALWFWAAAASFIQEFMTGGCAKGNPSGCLARRQ